MIPRVFRQIVLPALAGAGALLLYQQLTRESVEDESESKIHVHHVDGGGRRHDGTTDGDDALHLEDEERRSLLQKIKMQAVEITHLKALLALLDAHARASSNASSSPVLALLQRQHGDRTGIDHQQQNPFSPLHVRDATGPAYRSPVARVALDFG